MAHWVIIDKIIHISTTITATVDHIIITTLTSYMQKGNRFHEPFANTDTNNIVS